MEREDPQSLGRPGDVRVSQYKRSQLTDRIDLPPNYINPLKTYQDVAEIVENNWPTRQALFDEDVPDQFKRLLGLTVCCKLLV